MSGSPEKADTAYRYYVINEKIELGEMAAIFFDKTGVTFFYVCLVVYLYGDLSIYGAAVAKSLADVACTYQTPNFTCNDTIPDTELCWEGSALNRLDAYRIFLVNNYHTIVFKNNKNFYSFFEMISSGNCNFKSFPCSNFQTLFVFTLGPFVFFNIQKTKYLQLLTSLMRWLAFAIMIIYAARILIIEGPQGSPPAANVLGKSKEFLWIN